jgi:DNA polymerase-3 subunit gamma/tau
MSYEVIARKWRPKVLDQLIGQNHISQTLWNSLNADRIPHALLFTGPRGTGKTSTARILAKSLRCPNAVKFVPCNDCPDCDDISLSRSVNVIEIDGASNNGVDSIRQLRESVGFMPSSGKYKIYIIDEVHMLSGSAFNALLKTLEEPPPHVVFILATTEVQKIPNTVMSRCQRYDFRKISTRLIAAHLESICKDEKIKFEKEAIWTIARNGDGSMRDSQSLLDQVINFSNNDLSLKTVTEVLGLTDRQVLLETLNALIEKKSQAIIPIIEKVYLQGHDPLVFIRDLLEVLRHLMLVKVTQGTNSATALESILDLPNEEIESLQKLATRITEEDLHLIFDMALKGTEDVFRAQDARIVLEMVLLRMAIAPRMNEMLQTMAPSTATSPDVRAANEVSVSSLPPASATATSTASTTPSTSAPAVKNYASGIVPAPTGPKPPHANSLSEKWTEFVDRVRKVNGLVAAQLDQLHLTDQKGTELYIGVPEKYKFLADQVNDPNFHKKLVNYLNTFWGPGHTVRVETMGIKPAGSKEENLSPTQLKEKKHIEKEAQISQQVDEHPLVRQAKSILNTQVKSIQAKNIRENT